MRASVTVRPAERADVPGVVEVLRAALGETPLLRRTVELFEWKHRLNPFGESIVLLAEAGGRIAGVRAMMRWQLHTPSGHTVRCLRPVDTATHPDFARMGIFRTLTLEALDLAREEGIHLVFNTPNPRSAAGYLKMGWTEVGWIDALVRVRLGTSLAPPSEGLPRLGRVLPEATPFSPPALADRPPLGLRTPRHSEYWRWRFQAHPTARYGWMPGPEEGGAVVRISSRKGRLETVLADLLGEPKAGTVRRVRRSSRARYVVSWFARGTPERRALIRGGMHPVPGLRTLRLVALPLADLDVDVHDLGSWDLATSDLELL